VKAIIKTNITVFFAVLLVVVLCSFTACSAKSVINELPDEEIVKVVRVALNESGEETETELAKEKISSFYDSLSSLKYKRYYNVFGVKTSVFDGITYIITYDNYMVKLASRHLLVIRNGKSEKEILFSTTQPTAAFDEIDELFE